MAQIRTSSGIASALRDAYPADALGVSDVEVSLRRAHDSCRKSRPVGCSGWSRPPLVLVALRRVFDNAPS